MAPKAAGAPITDAITELRPDGGLVVVTAGPGAGTSHALRDAVAACRGLGLRVEDAAEIGPGTVGDQAVVVTSVTAGLAWPSGLTAEAGRLLDESRVRVVRLPPLTAVAVRAIVRTAAPALPDAEVDRLAAAAGGNPLVATHLARHGPLREPAIDAVLISRLLDRFGPAARSVAAVAAVLGSVTLHDLDLVADVCELRLATATHEFDVLVQTGILTPGQDGYGLAVPWLAEALYETLGPATRDRVHRAAADALIGRTAVRHDLVAHHLLRSSPSADDTAVTRLLAVAEPLTTTAPAVAVECYRRALAQLDGPPHRVAELTARLARASLLAGRPEDTVDVGRALLDDPEAGSSEAYPWLLPVVTEAMKATSAVEEVESILYTSTGGIDELLDTQAAYLFAASGRDDQARERVRRARDSLAKHSIRGRVNMLSNLLHAQCIAGDFVGLRDDAELLTDLIDEVPDEARLHAWATLAHVRSVEGDLTASARAATHAEELLRDETWGIYVPSVRYARAAIGFADGHWDEALRIAAQADGPLATSGTVSYLHLMRHLRARILANRGEFTDARKVAGAPVPAPRFISAMRTLALAETQILEGSVGAATERLQATLRENTLPGEIRAGLLAKLASAAAARGDGVTVRNCVAEIDQRSGLAAASRQVRLELRLALARAESSPKLAHAVLEEATEHGFTLFRGCALLMLGSLDVEPETNLTDAMTVFGDLNAVPWRRATATELRERGLRVPRRARTSADSLTETEIQLARLVQAARSNKEIADVMSLSVKTIEVYLSRLYSKVGCKSRLDLARAADEGRLPLG